MAPPQERFIQRVVEFLDFFKSILEDANRVGIETPASPFVMDLIKNFVKKEDPDKAITTFILRSYQTWDRALSREKDYFRTDGLKCFHGISEKHLEEFNSLFDVKKPDGTMLIDETIQSGIWELFESLIRTSICYVHLQRAPDAVTKKYTKSFFPEIKIRDNVEKWKITSLE